VIGDPRYFLIVDHVGGMEIETVITSSVPAVFRSASMALGSLPEHKRSAQPCSLSDIDSGVIKPSGADLDGKVISHPALGL
jgi:hypothetical protein